MNSYNTHGDAATEYAYRLILSSSAASAAALINDPPRCPPPCPRSVPEDDFVVWDPETSVDCMDKTYGTAFGDWVRCERHVSVIGSFLAESIVTLRPSVKEIVRVLSYVTKDWTANGISTLVRCVFPAADAITLVFVISNLPCGLLDLLLQLLPAIACEQARHAVLDALVVSWDFGDILALIDAIDRALPGMLEHRWKLKYLRRWAISPQRRTSETTLSNQESHQTSTQDYDGCGSSPSCQHNNSQSQNNYIHGESYSQSYNESESQIQNIDYNYSQNHHHHHHHHHHQHQHHHHQHSISEEEANTLPSIHEYTEYVGESNTHAAPLPPAPRSTLTQSSGTSYCAPQNTHPVVGTITLARYTDQYSSSATSVYDDHQQNEDVFEDSVEEIPDSINAQATPPRFYRRRSSAGSPPPSQTLAVSSVFCGQNSLDVSSTRCPSSPTGRNRAPSSEKRKNAEKVQNRCKRICLESKVQQGAVNEHCKKSSLNTSTSHTRTEQKKKTRASRRLPKEPRKFLNSTRTLDTGKKISDTTRNVSAIATGSDIGVTKADRSTGHQQKRLCSPMISSMGIGFSEKDGMLIGRSKRKASTPHDHDESKLSPQGFSASLERCLL